MKLIATKTGRYGTRALRAGEAFETSRAIGRVLVAVGRATAADGNPLTEGMVRKGGRNPTSQVTERPAPPAPMSEALSSLRQEYLMKVGKKPFHGWDAETLQAKIAEA